MVVSVLLAFVQGPQLVLQPGGPPIELVAIKGQGEIRDFKIGKYEVTQEQFQGFVQETGYDGTAYPSSKPTEKFLMNWKNGKPPKGTERNPICYVNWFHAKAYCAWLAKRTGLSVRLPYDEEWTLAACGPNGRKYPWGDAFQPKHCNIGGGEDGFDGVAPVGSFPLGKTPEGVYDMAGNIWEWSGEGHLRGGPWCMGPDTALSAKIADEIPLRCDDKFGFRVCVGTRRRDGI